MAKKITLLDKVGNALKSIIVHQTTVIIESPDGQKEVIKEVSGTDALELAKDVAVRESDMWNESNAHHTEVRIEHTND